MVLEATPPGLLVARPAQVTQAPVQAFLLPETGSGQWKWGCHGLNSDHPDSPNQRPLRTLRGLMWTHGLGSVKVRTQMRSLLD